MVIRFPCPRCGNRLKVPDDKAGRTVTCIRCKGRAVAPAAADAAPEEPERPPPPAPPPSRGRPWFGVLGMSRRVRGALALTLAPVVGCLLLAPAWAGPAAACSAVAVLAILHGHATGCPACGRWWARSEAEKTLVPSQEVDDQGVPVERLLDRTTYHCARCGHRWAVTAPADERAPGGARPERPDG